MLRHVCAVVVAAGIMIAGAGIASADEYKVRSGDTLSGIGATHGVSWRDIWMDNRQTIGGDPNLIFPGQVLEIGAPAGTTTRTQEPPDTGSNGRVRPATGSVTSSYGMRTHPITGVYKLHTGTDFGYGDGNAYAAAAGVVSISYPAWAGNLVTVDHGGGVQTRYAHLASVSVTSGERVDAGDVVGRIGALGMATGAHLHFEVMVNGETVGPLSWLD